MCCSSTTEILYGISIKLDWRCFVSAASEVAGGELAIDEQRERTSIKDLRGAMKAYVITTGVIFGLLTVAHIVRVVMGERYLATDPVFVSFTVLAAALTSWAWLVLRRTR